MAANLIQPLDDRHCGSPGAHALLIREAFPADKAVNRSHVRLALGLPVDGLMSLAESLSKG